MESICPSCNKPLSTKAVGSKTTLGPNGWIAWCGYGPCKSPNSNNEFWGETQEEAIKKALDEIIIEF